LSLALMYSENALSAFRTAPFLVIFLVMAVYKLYREHAPRVLPKVPFQTLSIQLTGTNSKGPETHTNFTNPDPGNY